MKNPLRVQMDVCLSRMYITGYLKKTSPAPRTVSLYLDFFCKEKN